MALEMFLKVDGVTGGSLNHNHRGWADVLSYSWSLNGGAQATDRAQMNEIAITKLVGVESTVLMNLFAARAPIKSAELNVIPTVGKREVPMKYLTLTLEDVRIVAISTGGGTEENAFKETLTLRFNRVKYESHHYSGADSNGGTARTASSHVFGWDLVEGAAC